MNTLHINRALSLCLWLGVALHISACADPVVTLPGIATDQSVDVSNDSNTSQDMATDHTRDLTTLDMTRDIDHGLAHDSSQDLDADSTTDMLTIDMQDMNIVEDMPVQDMDPDDMHIGTPCAVNQAQGSCQRIVECQRQGKHSTPGLCPGSSMIQCCTEPTSPTPNTCDPAAMPTPNAGMGEAPGVGGCPSGMIPVSTFCIDQYEASLLEVLSDGSARSWSPYFNPGTRTMKAVSIKGAVPQGYITGVQAAAACQQAGKRLCTSQEWLRACQGSASTTYPYGNTRQPGVCNDARATHPAIDYFGANDPNVWSKLGHQCINQQANTVATSGAYAMCKTVEDVHDMMGNLHEWTSDASGIFRGGFYADTTRNGNGCYYRTTAHNQQHWDYSTGFRCCHD